MTEQRGTVGMAILVIQLVREFVKHHIVSAAGVVNGAQYRVPGQDHRPFAPGFPRTRLTTFLHHAGTDVPRGRHDVGARIDQHGAQVGIIIRIAVQQEQARMGCDADPDFIVQLQTAASFELLFCQEHLDVPFQFPAIAVRQLVIKWAAVLNDPPPLRR